MRSPRLCQVRLADEVTRFVSGHDFSRADRLRANEGFRVCVRTRFLKGTGLGGGKESQVTRRNQSRRDGTICSPARECRVGFHANRVPEGTTQWVFSRKLFSPQ